MSDPSAEQPARSRANADLDLTHVASADQLRQCILDTEQVLVVGNRTKPALSQVGDQVSLVSTRDLAGVVAYEPSEFTFTAHAGTTIAELEDTLRKHRQYLPFDPPLQTADATLAGTLAAGLSGPGRHRFGGVRDFVLGADFITGDGTMIRSGGKVVKNAAGFDIPKLLVGSYGRLGAITSLTFKVFPRPTERWTYRIVCSAHDNAAAAIAVLARGRWELDAIDYHADTRTIWLRIGATRDVCDAIVKDIAKTMENSLGGGIVIDLTPDDESAKHWKQIDQLAWAPSPATVIAKVPMTLAGMVGVATWADQTNGLVSLYASVAGSLGWIACRPDSLKRLDLQLGELDLRGIVLMGTDDHHRAPLIGKHRPCSADRAVKAAMDVPNRFPGIEG